MKSKKLRLIVGALVVMMMGATLTGCGGSNEESGDAGTETQTTISISGSTSVGPLMLKVQEKYEAANSGVTLEVQENGSGAGIKDVINGVSEIGMSSRELKSEEASQVDGTVIAHDGIALLVNPANKVENITLEQIKDIYTGKITNWSEIEGGNDKEIVVAAREDGSGTRDAFQELIGFTSEELIENALISNGNGGLKVMVERNENAIAFVSFEYLDDLVNIVNVEGIEPKADSVRSGEYKISRPFLLVTREDNLSENGQKLIDYILSDEGQKIVVDNKLIPVK